MLFVLSTLIILYGYSVFLKARPAFILSSLLAIIAGALSLLCSVPVSSKLNLDPEKVYLAEVLARPRRPQVGEVKFIINLIVPFDSVPVDPNMSAASKSLKRLNYRLLCRAIDLPWRNASHIGDGDLFFIKAEFSTFHPSLNPFDYEQSLLRQGINGQCRIRYISKILNEKISTAEQFQNWVFRHVENIAGNGESAGLFLSMGLGRRDVLSKQTETAFKKTGLAHLLVVSGYQMTLVYMMISAVAISLLTRLPRFHLYFSIRLTAALLGIFGCLAYLLITGIDQSSARAVCAISSVIISRYVERGGGFLHSMLISFFVVQIVWPLSFLEPSVQLTFAALYAMYLATDDKGKMSALQACLYASIATSLVALCWFDTFSLIGFALNPLLASLVSIISCNVGFLALGFLLTGIDSGGITLKSVIYCLELVRDFVVYCASFPWVSLTLEGWHKVPLVLLLLLPIVWMSIARFRRSEIFY